MGQGVPPSPYSSPQCQLAAPKYPRTRDNRNPSRLSRGRETEHEIIVRRYVILRRIIITDPDDNGKGRGREGDGTGRGRKRVRRGTISSGETNRSQFARAATKNRYAISPLYTRMRMYMYTYAHVRVYVNKSRDRPCPPPPLLSIPPRSGDLHVREKYVLVFSAFPLTNLFHCRSRSG